MSRNRASFPGLLLALLALWVQLTLGAGVPRGVAVSALDAASVICHDGGAGDPGVTNTGVTNAGVTDRAPPAPRHPVECLLCPLCVSLTPAVFTPPDQPPTPMPLRFVVMPAAILPPATAPPGIVTLAGRPRGPPMILT